MMLGWLLARAGVTVVVLEKHKDFLRDFRGDTIHPSTLEVLYELGVLDEFLKRPHREIRDITGRVGGFVITTSDGTIEIDADLVVGADGRSSEVRAKAGLVVEDLGAPIDVLWMRMSRKPTDPQGLIGNLGAGIVFVMIDRDDYW